MKIQLFKEILFKFNKIHNLTNFKNIDFEINDSIEPLKFVNFKNINCAIDIGSGAGFPAIFLAIYSPNTNWHLFEPNVKKYSFLNYAKINLNLKNIKIYNQKIENYKKFKANLITSRALTKTLDLLEISNGFYDENTQFLFYKGSKIKEEIINLKAKYQIFKKEKRNYILIQGVKNDDYRSQINSI